MIAIPVLRGRVAPVLDWCSRFMIFPATAEEGSTQEFVTAELGPWERLQLLTGQGVQTLICGALSQGLQSCAAVLGMRIIPGVAGDIVEVLEAYRQNRLDQPEFWLPGCRGPRRYRQGFGNEKFPVKSNNQKGESIMPRGGRSGTGQGGGSGGCRNWRSNPEASTVATDSCSCPACGAKVPHQRGIPCTAMSCPQCGLPMVRQ